MLLLKAVAGVVDEARQLAFLDRIEELAADAAVAPLVTGLPIRGAVFGRGIPFRELSGDQLVEDAGGGGQRDRSAGLGAGGQGVAAAAVGVGDDEAVVLRLDGGLVDFVGIALAVVERGGGGWRGGVHGGCRFGGW